MPLYLSLLEHLLAHYEMQITFPQLHLDASQIVEQTSYKLLTKIQQIIANKCFSDEECFARIEQIVSVLEDAGCDCGGRHDF
nr:hypothetical protein [Maliibacterium massiliense]